jgi:hypothetical protein
MEIGQASSVVFVVIHTTDVDASPDCRTIESGMRKNISGRFVSGIV